MLQALDEAGIRPDMVIGTSIGAVNGVVVASDPHGAAERLEKLWTDLGDDNPFGGSVIARLATLTRTRVALHAIEPLRELLGRVIPERRFEDLAVPFQCVAASIEQARGVWFESGELLDAVLASTAVPGLLPPVRVGDEHFYAGGLVHSVPIGRALELGATEVYVMHVGRIEAPLTAPTSPLQVGLVAFEIARRHRLVDELDEVPEGRTVHLLPTGDPPRHDDLRNLRYRSTDRVAERIETARAATADYLRSVVEQDPTGG
ncbi:MAG: patatin-like phospholipase family protein [Actinobacteria bacterium]|nr:patatin-like phospholipase family protein [Actinomycetota bacterium]